MKPWQIMAHISELQHGGDYLCLPWKADGELAIMRGEDGRLTAFDNRCPHRGARIFTTLRGNRPPVCGYHGLCAKPEEVWRYALIVLDGWILVSERDPSDVVSTSGPEVWADDLVQTIKTPSDLSYHSTIEPYTYECHWTVAVENSLDREHIGKVHANTLASLKLSSALVKTYPGGSSLECFRADPHTMARLDDVFLDHSKLDYFHMHQFPYTALSSTRGVTFSLQHYFPRADGRTNFISRLYARPAKADYFLDAAAKFNAKVFREDAEICALVAPFHAGSLAPNEQRIAHFRAA